MNTQFIFVEKMTRGLRRIGIQVNQNAVHDNLRVDIKPPIPAVRKGFFFTKKGTTSQVDLYWGKTQDRVGTATLWASKKKGVLYNISFRGLDGQGPFVPLPGEVAVTPAP